MSTTVKFHIRRNTLSKQLQIFHQDSIIIPYSSLFFFDYLLQRLNHPFLQSFLEDEIYHLTQQIIANALEVNNHLQTDQDKKMLLVAILRSMGFGEVDLRYLDETGGQVRIQINRLQHYLEQSNQEDASFFFLKTFLMGLFSEIYNISRTCIAASCQDIGSDYIDFDFSFSTTTSNETSS
jgi:hypothetical protein